MCNCINMINDKLVEYNTAVTTTIALQDNKLQVAGVRVETHKTDTSKRGKPVSLTAAFCPFCGGKYEDISRGNA